MKKFLKVAKLLPLLLIVALLSVGYKIFTVKESDKADLSSKIKSFLFTSSVNADSNHSTGDSSTDSDSSSDSSDGDS